jgi:hypothetical protein
MSRRSSDEERIINFFETGHIEAVKSVFNMVRATVKRRTETPAAAEASVPKKPRKKRTPKTSAAMAAVADQSAA